MRSLFRFFLVFSCIGICLPDISHGATPTFFTKVEEIITIGKKIDTESKPTVRAILEEKRNALFAEAMQLKANIKTKFTEKPTLDVTSQYRLSLQKYSLSCEIAATRTVLQTILKKTISEDHILTQIPVFSGPKKSGIWGDPDKYFVGDIRGKQSNLTGYGVYEAPIADVFKRYQIFSQIRNIRDGSEWDALERLTHLLESLESGKHVILWGDWCTTPAEEDGIIGHTDVYVSKFLGIAAQNPCKKSASVRRLSWITPEGDVISALSGEHAFVLLGYIGEITDPTHVIVWDTKTGRHIYRTAEWMRKWDLMEYRSLVVEASVNESSR